MIKLFSKTAIFLVMVFFITLSTSWATYIADITYDYTDNGSGNYTFDFTVHNNSTGADTGGLDFFLIDFDADATGDPAFQNYSDISFTSANSWWNDFDDPDPSFGGTPGYVMGDDSDFYVGGAGGIAQGDSLGGFTVNFNYSGALLPTEQLFSWLVYFGTDDGGDIAGEDFGTTGYVPGSDDNPPVPEPATIMLFGLGLLGLAGVSRKK